MCCQNVATAVSDVSCNIVQVHYAVFFLGGGGDRYSGRTIWLYGPFLCTGVIFEVLNGSRKIPCDMHKLYASVSSFEKISPPNCKNFLSISSILPSFFNSLVSAETSL